jgi:hypothetical protein
MSQKFMSTLRGCFSLRILCVWSTLLISIWALSPVGGQAALRAMELLPDTVIIEHPMTPYPGNNILVYTSIACNYEASGGSSMINQFKAPVGAVFTAQNLGLLHANGSSEDFEDALYRAGSHEQAVRICRR